MIDANGKPRVLQPGDILYDPDGKFEVLGEHERMAELLLEYMKRRDSMEEKERRSILRMIEKLSAPVIIAKMPRPRAPGQPSARESLEKAAAIAGVEAEKEGN